MDPQRQPENASRPTRKENQIQGPKPSPLKVSKESHKISKKPPIPPNPTSIEQQSLPATGNQPVIIYSVSPKPIIVEPSNFRSIVQHLTGKQTTESQFSGDMPVSPAARFASIERTSPSGRERREKNEDEVFYEMMNTDDDIGVSNNNNSHSSNVNVVGGQNPGILSPSPANLPAISSAMFSSTTSENQLGLGFGGMNELMMSPYMSQLSFVPSPSSLLLSNAPIVSPSPSVDEFFNLFNIC